MLWVKNLLLLILVPGTVVLLVPYILLHSSQVLLNFTLNLFSAFLLFVFLSGALMVIWAVWAFTAIGKGTPIPFDPPLNFVPGGIYRFMRNPMYTGIVTMLLAESLYFRSLSIFLYTAFVFVFLNLFVTMVEEPGLIKRYGQPYLDYLNSVPRWLPIHLSVLRKNTHV